MFIMAILFTIAKKYKQPECPLSSEWINNKYPYNGMLFSNKNKILIHATT